MSAEGLFDATLRKIRVARRTFAAISSSRRLCRGQHLKHGTPALDRVLRMSSQNPSHGSNGIQPVFCQMMHFDSSDVRQAMKRDRRTTLASEFASLPRARMHKTQTIARQISGRQPIPPGSVSWLHSNSDYCSCVPGAMPRTLLDDIRILLRVVNTIIRVLFQSSKQEQQQ